MLRNVGAVFAGLFIGAIVNMAILMVSWTIYPMPPGMDMNDPDQMNAYLATLPTTAFLFAMAAHLAQAFVGGWIAARISEDAPMRVAMIVGILSLLGGVANMFNLDAPSWMWIEMPLYLAAAYAAATLELNRRA